MGLDDEMMQPAGISQRSQWIGKAQIHPPFTDEWLGGIDVGEGADRRRMQYCQPGVFPSPPSHPFLPADSGPATRLAHSTQGQTSIGSSLSPHQQVGRLAPAIILLFHLLPASCDEKNPVPPNNGNGQGHPLSTRMNQDCVCSARTPMLRCFHGVSQDSQPHFHQSSASPPPHPYELLRATSGH